MIGFLWNFEVIYKTCIWLHSQQASGVIPYRCCHYQILYIYLTGFTKLFWKYFHFHSCFIKMFPMRLITLQNKKQLITKIKTILKCMLITIGNTFQNDILICNMWPFLHGPMSQGSEIQSLFASLWVPGTHRPWSLWVPWCWQWVSWLMLYSLDLLRCATKTHVIS